MTKCIARAGAAMRVNGVLGDTVKYSAYGDVRSGGIATDYLYTSHTCPGGQCQGRNEAEIGLDYYLP